MQMSSIISMAAGTIPAPIIPDTAALASSSSLKTASSVFTASGRVRSRTAALVTIPSVPSEPTITPRRS